MEKPPVRGAIFDVDGTLVDSNDAHARAWAMALERHQRPVEFAEVRRLIGMGGDKLLPRLTDLEADSPLGAEIEEARAKIFRTQFLPHLRAFPGVRELFLRLKTEHVRIGIASSAKAEDLSALLDVANVRDLVEELASSTDAERSKPDPDIVHAALSRLELPAAEVIMIGDTPYDVDAATKIGVATIAVRSGGWSAAELHGALHVFEDVAELLARLEETPFAPPKSLTA